MQAIEVIATVLFALAIVHTFLTSRFEHLAHAQSAHAGLWHFFAEVEAVFGIWAVVLMAFMAARLGAGEAVSYLEGLNFTEPMFVFAIMVIAATRPIIHVCGGLVRGVAAFLPLPKNLAYYFVVLSLVPLLGSFVTEPAAMTLAALMLRGRFYKHEISARLRYATLAVVFVNISIGGTLTHFAAPPVLMVAGTWAWDTPFMLATFGWKAALAVLVNATAVSLLFRRELSGLQVQDAAADQGSRLPLPLVLIHLAFLAAVVYFAHHPVVFMAIFLLFLGLADAYEKFHDRLILREGLMVALFLAGLVVLGSLQKWWLQPLLADMDDTLLFFGAMGLTAVTDNAALTYLGSLVSGVDEGFKYALVAGAVTGGGLTVIANAPNPAGYAMLKDYFPEQAINALTLFLYALPPTLVAAAAFVLL